jgi:protein-S-isoprenylcysteine O-methyltransferase Ste14
MGPRELFLLAWVAWAISWFVAAAWSRQISKRIPPRDMLSYRLPIIAGAILLWHRTGEALGAQHLWHVGYNGAYALVGVAVAGFLFAWWARIYLGPLWSGAVTIKDDHTVVDTGPYALVRHPIYTGLITATAATAAAIATWPAIAGFVLITLGIWIKARIEERFLAAELGECAYGAYRRRVPMLLPIPGL